MGNQIEIITHPLWNTDANHLGQQLAAALGNGYRRALRRRNIVHHRPIAQKKELKRRAVEGDKLKR